MNHTVYADESGWIKGVLPNDVDPILFFGPITLQAVPSDVPVNAFTHCVFGGQVIEIGPQPTPFHVIQSGAWVLSRGTEIALAKEERNTAISVTDWMTTRHRDQLDKGDSTNLTKEQYLELLAYKQALRDWPVSGNYSEVFPEKPEWMQG